jgi:gas vesicle protein
LEDIGDTITGIFDGGKSTSSPSPSPSASASESSESAGKDASDTVKDTTGKVTDTVKDTVKDTTDKASKAAEDTTKAVEKAAEDAADKATSTPSPSATSTTDPDDCPAATDAEGGIDNKILLPDDPWYLEASSLTLKGADYQGVVKVKTANGTVKKVLKYVISDGTDIDDLHQLVKDKQTGKTYHVQAAKGSTSKITGGATVMYTERISGNLLGLIPLTFDPEHPPPLNIPRIVFTNVKVTQAGQFGGTLTVPGMHQYVTD